MKRFHTKKNGNVISISKSRCFYQKITTRYADRNLRIQVHTRASSNE